MKAGDPQNGDWREFRRPCETSCLSPFCPDGGELGPACSVLAWIQFLRPSATPRIEFSARLLLSSRSRVSLRCYCRRRYVTCEPATATYTLPPEQAPALAVENSPVFLPGFFQIVSACFNDAGKLEEAFRTGKGVGWHEHHHDLFHGTERFFRPGYSANLMSGWIPALDGVEEKLRRGAKVADVGCGLGASAILMAKAFPKSEFFGFDYHPGSIELAREAASREGISPNVHFEVASAKAFPGNDYDLVAFFDCLHDMGDPAGAAAHVRSTLKPDGSWMIVEPFAEDTPEGNHNPVGRIFYSASAMLCVPASVSQEVGAALGAQAGENRIREVVTSGGFSHFRRATQTPFNLVFETKP